MDNISRTFRSMSFQGQDLNQIIYCEKLINRASVLLWKVLIDYTMYTYIKYCPTFIFCEPILQADATSCRQSLLQCTLVKSLPFSRVIVFPVWHSLMTHVQQDGGGGVLQTNSNPKCQVLTKFSFFGVGGIQTNIPEILEWGHSRNFWTKNSGSLACCIADSLSHTMCVETIIAYQEREDSCTILMCDED